MNSTAVQWKHWGGWSLECEAPKHNGERCGDRDRDGEHTWNVEGRGTLSFDRITVNLSKRGYRALMCWVQSQKCLLLTPESEGGVCVCVCVWVMLEVGATRGWESLAARSSLWESYKIHSTRLIQNQLTFWEHISLGESVMLVYVLQENRPRMLSILRIL